MYARVYERLRLYCVKKNSKHKISVVVIFVVVDVDHTHLNNAVVISELEKKPVRKMSHHSRVRKQTNEKKMISHSPGNEQAKKAMAKSTSKGGPWCGGNACL